MKQRPDTHTACPCSAKPGEINGGDDMEKLKVLDLFSGAGMFSYGLEQAGGFKTTAFCEIENFPRKVLIKHWPDVPMIKDVRSLDYEMEGVKGADVITAGFPCQDVSFAGFGAGLSGERSGLWWKVRRSIRMVRPRFAVLENVAALLNRGMGSVLGSLAKIGYDTEWNCIPSAYVGGWSFRDRVWIIAYPDQKHCKGGIKKPIFNQSSLSRKPSRMASGWPGRSNLPAPVFSRTSSSVANRVDRTEAIGNSIDPKIPEMIGYAILEAEKETT